jgi:uncharacterized protein (TIGR00255 family)
LNYREKELDLRKIIKDEAHRGKFDFTISTDDNGTISDVGINKSLFKNYYHQLKELDNELQFGGTDFVQAILRIPNVVQADVTELADEEWAVVEKLAYDAIRKLIDYRAIEGLATKTDLVERIKDIKKYLQKTEEFEADREGRLRARLMKNVQDYSQNTNLDQNRMEQEILFYMEKMDINEEKMRLEQHLDYFIEEIEKPSFLKGRKLSFIAQEIGREINTMGAKAQHTDTQKLVVMMKNELEKIKEQLANIV